MLLSENQLRRRCIFEHPDAAKLFEGAAFEKVLTCVKVENVLNSLAHIEVYLVSSLRIHSFLICTFSSVMQSLDEGIVINFFVSPYVN